MSLNQARRAVFGEKVKSFFNSSRSGFRRICANQLGKTGVLNFSCV